MAGKALSAFKRFMLYDAASHQLTAVMAAQAEITSFFTGGEWFC